MSIVWGPLSSDVTDEDGEREALIYFVYARLAKSYCFGCGQNLTEFPLVHWHGGETDIFMHHQCAQRLAIHLAKDGLLAEKGIDVALPKI